MKKLLTITASLALIGISLSSCNKDYTCVCSLAGVTTNEYDIRATNKNKAQDECNGKTTVAGVTRECKIK